MDTMDTIERSRVTSAALRMMRMGETVQFGPMTVPMMNSGKAMAYQMGRVLGCSFTATSDYERGVLTLKKMERRV